MSFLYIYIYNLLVLFSQVPSESRLNTGNDKRNLPSNEWNHQNMLLSYQVRQFTPINKYHSSTFYVNCIHSSIQIKRIQSNSVSQQVCVKEDLCKEVNILILYSKVECVCVGMCTSGKIIWFGLSLLTVVVTPNIITITIRSVGDTFHLQLYSLSLGLKKREQSQSNIIQSDNLLYAWKKHA